MKNEALMQLQQILGEEAGVEVFERVVKLLENSTFSILANNFHWQRNDFENLTLLLMERLETALGQMEALSVEERPYSSDDLSWEKFLNLTTDLLRTKIITPWEFQVALKKPKRSTLPRLLKSLKDEAKELFSLLVIGYPEKNKNPVEQCEIEELLALAARKHVA